MSTATLEKKWSRITDYSSASYRYSVDLVEWDVVKESPVELVEYSYADVSKKDQELIDEVAKMPDFSFVNL